MSAREAQRRYKEKHGDLLRARALDYYHKNKDRDAEARRMRFAQYYADNRSEMLDGFRERYQVHKNSIGAKHRNDPRPRMLSSARTRAVKKGMEFSITIDDIHVPLFCSVFGTLLSAGTGDNAPSLDRIDNSLGYVPGNVWIISDRANRIKRDATLEELRLLTYKLSRPLKFPWEP